MGPGPRWNWRAAEAQRYTINAAIAAHDATLELVAHLLRRWDWDDLGPRRNCHSHLVLLQCRGRIPISTQVASKHDTWNASHDCLIKDLWHFQFILHACIWTILYDNPQQPRKRPAQPLSNAVPRPPDWVDTTIQGAHLSWEKAPPSAGLGKAPSLRIAAATFGCWIDTSTPLRLGDLILDIVNCGRQCLPPWMIWTAKWRFLCQYGFH